MFRSCCMIFLITHSLAVSCPLPSLLLSLSVTVCLSVSVSQPLCLSQCLSVCVSFSPSLCLSLYLSLSCYFCLVSSSQSPPPPIFPSPLNYAIFISSVVCIFVTFLPDVKKRTEHFVKKIHLSFEYKYFC